MTSEDTDHGIVSKAEFGRMTNKSRSLVSKWIARGTLCGDALVGEPGPAQRIDSAVALRQLSTRRDPGQRLGNGAATLLTPIRTDPPASPTAFETPTARCLALLHEIPTIIAWEALYHGAAPWLAYALAAAVQENIVGVGKTEFRLNISDLFPAIDWASPLEEYAPSEKVDVVAWEAMRLKRVATPADED